MLFYYKPKQNLKVVSMFVKIYVFVEKWKYP